MTRVTSRGATIIEMAVTLSVIAVLVSGLGTAIYSTVLNARSEAALNQLDLVKKAIVGEPRSLPPGEEYLIRYGFLGDMGVLPATLPALESAGAQPYYSVDSVLQLGTGWRGPYIAQSVGTSVDPWGQGLVYSTAAGTSALTGAPVVGSIRTTGGDGIQGTADDYVVEIYRSEAFAKVVGYVKDLFGATLPGISVKLSYPNNGVLTTATTVSDNEGLYTFDAVPNGSRVLQLEPRLSYQRGTGYTTGNDRNDVEFVVENLGRLATSITSIKVTYTSNPEADFSQLSIDGATVFSGTAASTATINFGSRTVNGTGVIQEPFRVDVSGQNLVVPDAIVGTVGTGGKLTFKMTDFEEVATNNNVDMTGVTFTLEFSDGSKTLFSPARKR